MNIKLNVFYKSDYVLIIIKNYDNCKIEIIQLIKLIKNLI